ncbi:MAG: hypothetical protein QXX13_07120 [Candidatus Methanomethylicia archaeon]
MDLERFIEEWRREDEEAKEIRGREVDWNFIEKQKEPIKTTLKLLIETGDLRLISKITGICIDKLKQHKN